MQTRSILKPGQHSTKRLVAEYGQQLICVRYRYDSENRKRHKTVEFIVAEEDWTPPNRQKSGDGRLVRVRIVYAEADLRRKVKAGGGVWDAARRRWVIRRELAIELGLADRIEEETL